MADELTVNFRITFSSGGVEMDFPPKDSSGETSVDVLDTSPNDMTILVGTDGQFLPSDIVFEQGLFALQNLDDTNFVELVDYEGNAPPPMRLMPGDPPFFFRSLYMMDNDGQGYQLKADTAECYVRVIYIRDSS